MKACLNGSRRREEHPAVPLTPDELAAQAIRAVSAGAAAVHAHPRDASWAETLEAVYCDAVVAALRASCPRTGIGLTTGAWIVPDPARRLAAVSAWRVFPDFASVNFSETGARELCDLLLRLGIGVEAGLASVADARALASSDVAARVLSVLVEVGTEDPAAALSEAEAIHAVLDEAGVDRPRLQHGVGGSAWTLLEDARRRGHDVRVGLEDTLVLPDGRPAHDNADLVAAAVRLVRTIGP